MWCIVIRNWASFHETPLIQGSNLGARFTPYNGKKFCARERNGQNANDEFGGETMVNESE